jgi:hypothetical protein
MQIAITGATGLVGSHLMAALQDGGHEVRRLVRGNPQGDDIRWSPQNGEVEAKKLEGCDAVIHLAGESIAAGRWNDAKKARIRDSRVQGTTTISEALAGLEQKPKTLISASAIGIYGDRGDELLDDSAPPGTGFLADVCQQWEQSTTAAAEAGIRVVHPRIGIVLSVEGGALAKMLLPFKLGLGGKIGSGEQYMSWIARDELTDVIKFCIEREEIEGAFNAVSPAAVTNQAFTKALGSVLQRPTIFPMPALAARLALGEMADALLLASNRVAPRALERHAFPFRQSDIGDALRHVIENKI